jgi:hypothetical protein
MAFSPFQNQDSPNEVNAPKPNPVGQPFRRYIGRDEVQKRAISRGGANMFGRPPVVAPAPGQPAPASPVLSAVRSGAPSNVGTTLVNQNQNGGINPGGNSFPGSPINPAQAQAKAMEMAGVQQQGMVQNMVQSSVPRPANPGLRAPMPGYTGGGGGMGQPPQVQPPTAPVAPGNLMPVVRPGQVQFSLANRGWGA